MSEKFISEVHIEKLGHKLSEIRERALNNIISKLEQNYNCDYEISRTLKLYKKLIQWFTFDSHSEDDKVLLLLLKILQSKTGELIIKHLGKSKIVDDVKLVDTKVQSEHCEIVAEILKYLENVSADTVPVLFSEVPLSYRTDNSENDKCESVFDTFNRSRLSSENTSYKSPPRFRCDFDELNKSDVTLKFAVDNSIFEVNDSLPIITLNWVVIPQNDVNVLKSLEESLKNPAKPSALLHSCEFFRNVILQDFSPEVFLQRNSIVNLFYEFVNSCPSNTIRNTAILSLCHLTEKLIFRLNQIKDPAIFCKVSHNKSLDFKTPKLTHCSQICDKISNLETRNDELLMLKQISLQDFCINTMFCVLSYISERQTLFIDGHCKRKIKYGMNFALNLFDKLIVLMSFCIKPTVWEHKSINSNLQVTNKLKNLLNKLGDVLNDFCLKMYADDMDKFQRIIQLHLLHSTCVFLKSMVPLISINNYIPRSLKNSLSNCLLDAPFSRIYSSAHETLHQYVQEFQGCHELQSLKKYKDIQEICKAMTAAVKFLKDGLKCDIKDSLQQVKDSLPSLEFHNNLAVIDNFLQICIEFYPVYSKCDNLQKLVDHTMLEFLSHTDEKVQLKMYSEIRKLILDEIGVKYSKNAVTGFQGSQILFILRPNVFIQITCHGLNHKNIQISTHSEDILIHVLKCKILVSEEIWQCLIESLTPSLALMQGYVDLKSPLGKTIFRMIDPDISSSISIPKIEIMKGNLRMLFNRDLTVRYEAVSRLCWLLTLEKDADLKMPKITYLKDCGLSNIFQGGFNSDFSKNSPRNFYQASSLHQVMELLASTKVEPSIRRSALTQTSVMLNDNFLHPVFLEKNGLNLILDIFQKSFYSKEYSNYLDSVIPIVTILKNICLYNAGVRQELSANKDFFYSFLRALFLYSTEKRMQHDGAILLALLVFSEFVIFNSMNNILSLPELVIEKFKLPFKCSSHWKTSPYSMPSLLALYKNDSWAKSALRMHWNIEWHMRIDELIANSQNFNESTPDFDSSLRLSQSDLNALKATSATHCCQLYLHDLQNATTHAAVCEAVQGIQGYINLYILIAQHKMQSFEKKTLLTLPWKANFLRFLCAPPASTDDQNLLTEIIDLLQNFVKLSKSLDETSWITEIIKDSSHYFFKMLQNEITSKNKNISNEILNLIIECSILEKSYNNLPCPNENLTNKSWVHVIDIINGALKFKDSDEFQDLAYVDKLLSCLTELTSNSGWSLSNSSTVNVHKILKHLIENLASILLAFHYGKGKDASSSSMGISITRNALISMNHILSEMQNFYNKPWEPYWIRNEICDSTILNLDSLWSSRDDIIRAAMLDFIIGLTISDKGAAKVIESMEHSKNDSNDSWRIFLAILLDHSEPSIVREKAGAVLVNFTGHIDVLSNSQVVLTIKNNIKTAIDMILDKFYSMNFFEEINTCLCSFSKTIFEFDFALLSADARDSEKTSSGSSMNYDKQSQNDLITVVTPKLVTKIAQLLKNLLSLDPNRITDNLLESGIILNIFRCITNPIISITTLQNVYLYENLLEMLGYVCHFLTECVTCNPYCMNIILHTRDSLFMLISLLQLENYDVRSESFIKKRNKLWSKIFILLTAIINIDTKSLRTAKNPTDDCYNTLTSLIIQIGYENFLKVVLKSICCKSEDLQQSTLQFIISMFSLELTCTENQEKAGLFKSLLDETKSFKNIDSETKLYDINEQISDTYKSKILVKQPTHVTFTNVDYLGADFCRALMQIYEENNLNNDKNEENNIIAIKSLSVLLNMSDKAKMFALQENLIENLIEHLRNLHLNLSLHSTEMLRKISEKKKVMPILKEANNIFCLFANFIYRNSQGKIACANLGLADLAHKFWVWFSINHTMLRNLLNMLCTLTVSCEIGCQALIFTNKAPGTGPRKMSSSLSLLHAILTLISKEMDMLSSNHDVQILNFCFEILENVCSSLECRTVISKSNIFQNLGRLHPSVTKSQNNYEIVESICLHFIVTFTYYPEGQICIAKNNDTFEVINLLANSTKSTNKTLALAILRNIAFHQSNKVKLLTSVEFIQILHTKLQIGNFDEQNIVISIIWTLIANSQRSKIIIKCAGLDARLSDVVKRWQMQQPDSDALQVAIYVLNLLQDKSK